MEAYAQLPNKIRYLEDRQMFISDLLQKQFVSWEAPKSNFSRNLVKSYPSWHLETVSYSSKITMRYFAYNGALLGMAGPLPPLFQRA